MFIIYYSASIILQVLKYFLRFVYAHCDCILSYSFKSLACLEDGQNGVSGLTNSETGENCMENLFKAAQ